MKKLSHKFLVLLLLSLSLLLLNACTDQQVAKEVNAFNSSLLLFEQSEIALHNQKLIDDPTHHQIQLIVNKTAITSIELTKLLQSKTVNKADTLALVNQALGSTQVLLDSQTLGIKDPKTMAEFNALVVALRAPIVALVPLLGGK